MSRSRKVKTEELFVSYSLLWSDTTTLLVTESNTRSLSLFLWIRSLGWLSWAFCSGVSHKAVRVLARATVSSEAQLEKEPLLGSLRLLGELTFLWLQNWEILSLAGCYLELVQVTGWRPLSGSQSHFQCLATGSFPTWSVVSSEPARETASSKKGSARL